MKYLFAAVMFMIGTDTFIVSPLLPVLRAEFGIEADTSGWLMAAYALGYAVTAVIAGPLTESRDRKKVLIAGLTGFAAFTALCGTAHSFDTMFLFRLLAGVSAAIASPQVWAAIPQTVPASQTLRAMGVASAGLSVSQVLGVPIGSLLAHANWRIPFFAVGALTLPVIAGIAAALPSLKPPGANSGRVSILASYRRILRRTEGRFAFPAHFFYFVGMFGALTYVGNWMSDEFGLDVSEIGLLVVIYGMGNLTGNLWGSRITARWGPRAVVFVALLAIGASYASAPALHNVAAAALLLFVCSFAGGTAFPLIMSSLQSIDTGMRGTIFSLANSVMYMGTTAGSAIAGQLYVEFGGFAGVGLMTSAAELVALALFLRSRLFSGAGGSLGEASAKKARI